ncbi:MAG: glycoside hydrolase family 25 [Oscillospiraceae bacterium]|nr:glycoside hydrolase family 25 [Oscillospiraceae bacterium]
MKRRIAYHRIFGTLFLLALLIVGIWGVVTAWRVHTGELKLNVPDPEQYPVNGVDVSRYQGHIEWDVIASQDITFAFIKATEGSSYRDPLFAYNWEAARANGVYAGAYHFFSFESEGTTQAQNFIAAVGALDKDLPPVVDLEFYGDYVENPLSKAETRRILDDLLDTLEAHYGVKPIIYTTPKAYYSYILGGGYGDHPLWMRNTYFKPPVSWEFWQYSDQGLLEGYDGKQADNLEMYIDLNVYNGSHEEFLEEFDLTEEEETE